MTLGDWEPLGEPIKESPVELRQCEHVIRCDPNRMTVCASEFAQGNTHSDVLLTQTSSSQVHQITLPSGKLKVNAILVCICIFNSPTVDWNTDHTQSRSDMNLLSQGFRAIALRILFPNIQSSRVKKQTKRNNPPRTLNICKAPSSASQSTTKYVSPKVRRFRVLMATKASSARPACASST